ncbi:hypothetical protein HanRHA438_Chr06g0282951 [Helianthus annuus]|nr:hypothetical protein HanRHA438_Chr06g0282951 [Helianthus annuus]
MTLTFLYCPMSILVRQMYVYIFYMKLFDFVHYFISDRLETEVQIVVPFMLAFTFFCLSP